MAARRAGVTSPSSLNILPLLSSISRTGAVAAVDGTIVIGTKSAAPSGVALAVRSTPKRRRQAYRPDGLSPLWRQKAATFWPLRFHCVANSRQVALFPGDFRVAMIYLQKGSWPVLQRLGGQTPDGLTGYLRSFLDAEATAMVSGQACPG